MNENLLITGSRGFISTYLINQFLIKGFNVYCIGSKYNNLIPKQNFLKKNTLRKNIEAFIKVNNFKYVIFAHGKINHSSSYEEIYKDHFYLIKIVNENLDIKKIKKIIFLSSGDEYGKPLKLPISENHICNPISNYAHVKNHIVNYLFQYHSKNKKISIVVLRLFLIFGESQKTPRLLPLLKHKIVNNELFQTSSTLNQIKDFSHIADLFFYINKIINSKRCIKEIFNFGSGNRYPIIKVISFIEKKYKIKLKIKFNKTKTYNDYSSYPSIKKLQKFFGSHKFIKLNNFNF